MVIKKDITYKNIKKLIKLDSVVMLKLKEADTNNKIVGRVIDVTPHRICLDCSSKYRSNFTVKGYAQIESIYVY